MLRRVFEKTISVMMLLFFILGIFSIAAQGMNPTAIPYPSFQKGMTYVTWSREAFSSAKSDESLKSMAAAGINFVAVIPTYYQERFDSTEIEESKDRTPSDSSIRHVIKKAHMLNMAILLKPHIDLVSDDGSSGRGDIGFQSDDKWGRWCDNYVKFITHYARIAQKENVEIFCVGTELSFASTRTDMWKNVIIPAVRKVYSGRITYAANWDEYKNIEFWDDVDYAGIDAYFPLANKTSPTCDEIKGGWAKWVGEIEDWQARVNKPVIFTECGYCSVDSAAKKPWEDARGGSANQQAQADCYKAVFETFWNKPWFYGVYWWNWNTYPGSGGDSNKGFTPQNKLALSYIRQWYYKIEPGKIFNSGAFEMASNAELKERLAVESAGALHAETVKRAGAASVSQMAADRNKYNDKR